MLDDLDSSPRFMEEGGEDGFDDNCIDNKLIGINEESLSMTHVIKNFKIAKSRALCHLKVDDYLLNATKRENELGSINNNPDSSYSKALFYMYGACESLGPETGTSSSDEVSSGDDTILGALPIGCSSMYWRKASSFLLTSLLSPDSGILWNNDTK